MAAFTNSKSTNKLDETGIHIKIFTNYFQIVSSLSTFDLDTPPGLMDIGDSVGNPVKQMSFSLDCFLVEMQKVVPSKEKKLNII